MHRLTVKAPAKLNLHLQVLRKREDEFHNIASALQLINLFDELTFIRREKEIELVEYPNPIKANLVYQAAHSLKKKTNTPYGAKITLKKNIPIQKGLGGGSSDAAATLIALNKLWRLNLTKDQLAKIALELGSDVPFFVYGQSAWVEGKGELIKKIQIDNQWFILIFPEVNISTREAYNSINLESEAAITLENFLAGKSKNSFESWVRTTYSDLDILFHKLQPYGVPKLTGTGSAVYISFNHKKEAEEKFNLLNDGILVESIDRSPLLPLIE